MAKSPNGKIVKSLHQKIAFVWTKPNRHLAFFSGHTARPLVLSSKVALNLESFKIIRVWRNQNS